MIRCAFCDFLILFLLYFIGNNGYIWISPSTISEDDAGGFAQNLSVVIEIGVPRATTSFAPTRTDLFSTVKEFGSMDRVVGADAVVGATDQ